MIPGVTVKHHFRKRVPYPLEWETVLHNRLRFALVHLSPERIAIGKNQKPGGKPTTPTTPEPPKKKSGKK